MSRRARRGHLLLEALVASAVFLTAIGGLAGGLIAASKQIGIASLDQQALMIARGELDSLQGERISSARWNVGSTGPSAVAGAPGFTLTTTVSAVAETTGPVSISYRRAVVGVMHQSGRSVSLEALRW